jgi:DNA repair exonuclease SbcCD ATPase subunit
MKSVVFASAVVVAILIVLGFIFFPARGHVAGEKLLSKIDNLLGENKVKREQIKIQMRGLSEGCEQLRKEKFKARITAEQINEGLVAKEKEIQETESTLKKLRPYFDGEKTEVLIGGHSYTIKELQEKADDFLKNREKAASKLESGRKRYKEVNAAAESIEAKQKSLQEIYERNEMKLEEVDEMIRVLKIYRNAAKVMGGDDDENLAQKVETLEKNINGLYADVAAEREAIDQKWEEVSAGIGSKQDSELIENLREPEDTKAEIDAIFTN